MVSHRKTFAPVAVFTAAAFLLTGCATTHTADNTTPTAVSSINTSLADAMFAQMMIPHHQQAVEMSTLAETRTTNPELLALAADIKAAQQPEIDQMAEWLNEWGAPIPTGDTMADHAGHGGMAGMLTPEQMQQLADAEGAEFDRLYAEYMILHHEGAVQMAEDVANSNDPRVKTLAQTIITTQTEEIAELQALLNQ